ncbi:uncharacterized protein ColSpa_02577 [Colletotrichum spaethianum]|uniref:Uncharacterized protein n=1 Tax=Colletotrichum spaethianum TaxID=700344 RepID=A0AA37P4Y5_9PEZI|nr:uncharacterized protein ColSpa_02577 [Colletotrichum spaethianum]GKT42396.1 hypothetical protein ColSpa_02577 [Colletotrichum spaethianum]
MCPSRQPRAASTSASASTSTNIIGTTNERYVSGDIVEDPPPLPAHLGGRLDTLGQGTRHPHPRSKGPDPRARAEYSTA